MVQRCSSVLLWAASVALLGFGVVHGTRSCTSGWDVEWSLMSNEDVQEFRDFMAGSQVFCGSLYIFGDVTSLDFMDNLQEVHGDVSVMNSFLETLEGLEQLAFVGGDLSLSYNTELTSVEALSQLKEVKGNLEISYNDALESLAGLGQLQAVGGSLILNDNQNLTVGSLSDLAQLQQVKDLMISSANQMILKSTNVRDPSENLQAYITLFDEPMLEEVFEDETFAGSFLQG